MKKISPRTGLGALVLIIVFLVMIMPGWFYDQPILVDRPDPTINHSLPGKGNELVLKDDFGEKNADQVKKLEEVAARLRIAIPNLGVTSREFNQNLGLIVALLQKQDSEKSGENWEQFQEDFAYQYKEMYTLVENQIDLPKDVRESQAEIMEILQDLNHIIQDMHK